MATIITGPAFNDAVTKLAQMRTLVLQYAPQLSSEWGYLTAQAQAISNGQPASITQDALVARVATLAGEVSAAGKAAINAPGAGDDTTSGTPGHGGTWLPGMDTGTGTGVPAVPDAIVQDAEAIGKIALYIAGALAGLLVLKTVLDL